jgi:hypothetical protein
MSPQDNHQPQRQAQLAGQATPASGEIRRRPPPPNWGRHMKEWLYQTQVPNTLTWAQHHLRLDIKLVCASSQRDKNGAELRLTCSSVKEGSMARWAPGIWSLTSPNPGRQQLSHSSIHLSSMFRKVAGEAPRAAAGSNLDLGLWSYSSLF